MTATNSQPRIAALVPMRHSSERVPNKNFRPFHDRPLYHWIVSALLDAPSVGEVVIDTDSPTIRDDARKHFPRVRVIERPEHLRDGSIPMNDVLLNTVKQIDAYRKEYGRDHLPFEYQSMSAEAFSVDGVRRLEDLGIEEAIVAFRNPYAAEPDTQTLDDKIGAIRWFADSIIQKVR